MKKFSNIAQENYDKIKIFLISNYNISFVTGADSSITESFEITSRGLILGNYHDDFSLTLDLQSGDSSLLDTISQKISDLCDVVAEDTDLNSDDIDSILEHIQNCNDCKSKFSEILKHHKS